MKLVSYSMEPEIAAIRIYFTRTEYAGIVFKLGWSMKRVSKRLYKFLEEYKVISDHDLNRNNVVL